MSSHSGMYEYMLLIPCLKGTKLRVALVMDILHDKLGYPGQQIIRV